MNFKTLSLLVCQKGSAAGASCTSVEFDEKGTSTLIAFTATNVVRSTPPMQSPWHWGKTTLRGRNFLELLQASVIIGDIQRTVLATIKGLGLFVGIPEQGSLPSGPGSPGMVGECKVGYVGKPKVFCVANPTDRSWKSWVNSRLNGYLDLITTPNTHRFGLPTCPPCPPRVVLGIQRSTTGLGLKLVAIELVGLQELAHTENEPQAT